MRIYEKEHSLLSIEVGEFWTPKQRSGHSLHEVSYRACYKPQLPEFFIKKYCNKDDVVYDPFMGRGTTLIEAQLNGCRAYGNDVNPLAIVLAKPRLVPPTLSDIEDRLKDVFLSLNNEIDLDLLVFFNKLTLQELYGWKKYFQSRQRSKRFDEVDAWIQMVACNRLTGHSKGFFSVYTLPPNQATSLKSQRRLNEKRNQKPEYRNTKELILKKSRQLLRHDIPPHFFRDDALLFARSADHTPDILDNSIDLVVTSPPFLDTVNYVQDNWLRMWFCDIRVDSVNIWQFRHLDDWVANMKNVFVELHRILKPSGRIAFEVGEVRKGGVFLEDSVIEATSDLGLTAETLFINLQNFTKTSNCWGVLNNRKGTNSNRIVVMRKD